MDPKKKASTPFKAPLPLLHKTQTVQVPLTEAEEVQQSIKMKKSALIHAMQAKRNVNILFNMITIQYIGKCQGVLRRD